MHADVQKHFAAIDAAQAEYDAAYATRDEEYARLRALAASAARKLDAARSAVGEGSLRDSSDPLVAWIATNALRAYPEHAEIILRALPATREQLDALAVRHDWCSEWESFARRAEQDGVLPERVKRSTEYESVLQWIADNYGTTARRAFASRFASAMDAEVQRVTATPAE